MNGGSRRSGLERHVSYRDLLRALESSAALNESYETLLSSLRLLNGVRPLRTLLFTSAQPQEGKTTVVACLALIMARAGKRTLIVDADLRRPRIHQIFGLENAKGLIDVVAGKSPGAEVVQVIQIPAVGEGKMCTLAVVTSGRSSARAIDAIRSPSLADEMRGLAQMYDSVVIDSPPVLSVSDSLLLAPLVDGVVLIVSTSAVTEADAKRAKERLEQAGGRVVGVVMNRFDEKLHGPGFHPYHAYYETTKSRS